MPVQHSPPGAGAMNLNERDPRGSSRGDGEDEAREEPPQTMEAMLQQLLREVSQLKIEAKKQNDNIAQVNKRIDVANNAINLLQSQPSAGLDDRAGGTTQRNQADDAGDKKSDEESDLSRLSQRSVRSKTGCRPRDTQEESTDDEIQNSIPPRRTNRRPRKSCKQIGAYTDEDYEANADLKEMSAGRLQIKHFDFADSAADWSQWGTRYESAIFNQCNPKDRDRHARLNLKWVSTYLNDASFAIWNRCKHKSDSWHKLKAELDDAFDDPKIRANWSTDVAAYKWDQIIPLKQYASNVQRYVQKFDKCIVGVPSALQKSYYSRFLNGLPAEYKDQIDGNLPDGKETIERALAMAIKFQKVLERKKAEKAAAVVSAPAVAAPLSFGEEKRVSTLEWQVKQLWQAQKKAPQATTSYQHQTKSRPETSQERRTRFAGHTPYADPQKTNTSSDPRSKPGFPRRFNRQPNFKPKQTPGSGNSEKEDYTNQKTFGSGNPYLNYQKQQQQVSAAQTEELAWATDIESEAEEVDCADETYSEFLMACGATQDKLEAFVKGKREIEDQGN